MSTIPRKHHYVPQAHIQKFRNEDGYFVYNKNSNSVYNKKDSEIFVIKDLNSMMVDDGEIDHQSLEAELAETWDAKFTPHHDQILRWILDSFEQGELSRIDIDGTLRYFFEYALVGYQRYMKSRKDFNDSTMNSIIELRELESAIDEADLSGIDALFENVELGKKGLINFIKLIADFAEKSQQKLKFPAPITTDLQMFLPPNISCDVVLSKNQPFYLPDCTAMIQKSDESFEYQGKQLKKIALVGIPISSSVFLMIRNNEFFPEHQTSLIHMEDDDVIEINSHIISNAYKQVVVCRGFKPKAK